MSRLTLLVFLVALTAISVVHSGRGKCQRKVGRGGWGGKCFRTDKQLSPAPKCDALVYNRTINGCPGKRPACCVTDCSKQTKVCHRRYRHSIGKNQCYSPDCPHSREIGKVRPGSGCKCCKICKSKKRRCKPNHRRQAFCITQNDPKYNVALCTSRVPYIIKKRHCKGWGCWCCIWPK